MDTEVVRTFLEIVAQRNFGVAAERLNVAQTTVSARIRLLEEHLGRPLFIRNKTGATLTSAGEQLLRYAPTFVQLWERARHQVALPANKQAVLAMGGELSVWDPLLLKWLVWMREAAPEVAIRAKVGVAEELNSQVAEGVLDFAVLYTPQHRPGLEIELLIEEKLVLVTTRPNPEGIVGPDYVYVDWGSDFALHHSLSFPDMTDPGLFVSLGPLALNYILEVGGSGYFRLSAVQALLKTGALRLVPDTPEVSYPAYAVYGTNAEPTLIRKALDGLRQVAKSDTEPART
jgi:LysR family transcriptional regulator, flagellar master operon regulator